MSDERKMRGATVNVDLELVEIREMSALFKDVDERRVLLPLSVIEFDYRAEPGDILDVEMEEWIAREKGLI
jgi:hypothetical protein